MKTYTIFKAYTPQAQMEAIQAMVVCDVPFAYYPSEDWNNFVLQAEINRKELWEILRSELTMDNLAQIVVLEYIG